MEKKSFMTPANDLGPIRRGSVVLIDIPEGAPDLEGWPEDLEIPDGYGATVLQVKSGKALLYVGDDYGRLDVLIPLDWLEHENAPFGIERRNRLVYDMVKVNEHEIETEVVPHEDGVLEEEYLTCKHCKGFIEMQRLALEGDEQPVYIDAMVSVEAAKRCSKNPNLRGKVHLPFIPGYTDRVE